MRACRCSSSVAESWARWKRASSRRLKPGDVFMFAGRLLELVRTQQMTAYVRTAPKGSAALPRWNGGRMPLSNTLADAMLRQLEQAERGVFASPRCAARSHCWRCRMRGRPAHAQPPGGRGAARARAGTCTCTRWRGGWCTWGWRACWRGAHRSRCPTHFRLPSTTTGWSCCRPNRWTGLRCCRT